jgi:hypothetical protein
MPEFELKPHPATPCPHVRSMTVSVEGTRTAVLALRYAIEGDIDRLLLPAQTRSQRAGELWKSTCFEAFLRVPGTTAYIELNFSPSSEWAAYRFDRYREGMVAIEVDPAPRIVCRRRSDALSADVDVDLDALQLQRVDLEVALSTVLEDRHGAISYWALAHPPGKPDFHHADGFVLRLAAAGEPK